MNSPQHLATHRATGPKIWALLPCAGGGSRSGSSVPKQYRVLAGQTLLQHTLDAFAGVTGLSGVIVVTAPGDHFAQDQGMCAGNCRVHDVGGHSRAASVFNGLKALVDEGALAHDWVLVHDVARCLIRSSDIQSLISACQDDEVGGLLAVPLADTLKRAAGERVQSTLDRSDKWLAQTPQMFRIGSLLEALEVAGDQVTDEASAVETLGLQPRLVLGDPQNFKLTYPPDFALAELILLARARTTTKQE